jgi:hypothetical protein
MNMKWRIVHLLILVFALTIALAIHRSFWGPKWRNAVIVFGVYLAVLVATTIGACYSESRKRRPWLGYAVFGWLWLALVLRDYLGMLPDLYAPNKLDFSILGMALGVLCAVASQFLPGMRKS